MGTERKDGGGSGCRVLPKCGETSPDTDNFGGSHVKQDEEGPVVFTDCPGVILNHPVFVKNNSTWGKR